MTAPRLRGLLALCALLTAPGISAAESDDAVVVARGEHEITLGDIDARMTRFPEQERAQFARDPANLARLLDRLLVDRILSEEAKELGLDQDPLIRRDLEIAVQEVLATHRMNRFFDKDSLPDFRLLARERYLAEPEAFADPERLVVEHVLINTISRTEEEALALAEKVRGMAMKEPATFDELIAEYSDDPSKETNQGRFTIDDPEVFAPEFVEGARVLKTAGEVSMPVKTQFGYHIIRLVERQAARPLSFEEVEADLVRKVERDYRDNVRIDYLAAIRSRYPETGSEALLLELPGRYGGRPEDQQADAQPPAE